MRGLHVLVMAQKVLYLGASDMPAWVVVKANACECIIHLLHPIGISKQPAIVARANGLTPFSVYQGQWNAAFRDMEAEVIPMCEDEGLAVIPWAALGGGALMSADERKNHDKDAESRSSYASDKAVQVSAVLASIAEKHKTSLQSIVGSP